jgi:hypothetical protein
LVSDIFFSMVIDFKKTFMPLWKGVILWWPPVQSSGPWMQTSKCNLATSYWGVI